jgi:aromatic ring hydroxylase
MRLMTAVATMIAEVIGVIEYREVAAKLGEMITYVEMWVRHEALLWNGRMAA